MRTVELSRGEAEYIVDLLKPLEDATARELDTYLRDLFGMISREEELARE